jgi:hypothetical protein
LETAVTLCFDFDLCFNDAGRRGLPALPHHGAVLQRRRVPGLRPGVLPAVVSLAASFTVLFVVTWATGGRRPPEIDEDVALVMDL